MKKGKPGDACNLLDGYDRIVFGLGDFRLCPAKLANGNSVGFVGFRSATNLFKGNEMRCFLDIDGVLANFAKGAFEALGLAYSYDHPALRDWHWYNQFKIPFAGLNAVCDIDFWANLEWMHDGEQILDTIEDYFYPTFTSHPGPASLKPTHFENQIYLLTTPMPNPGSGTGKILWVEKHLPQYAKRLITTQVAKSIFAGPDCLLIDDNDENIDKFVAAGGRGILVPRPWNGLRGWADNTLEVVRNSLREVH